MAVKSARITLQENEQRRQTRIISHEIRIGEVILANDKPGFTKFSAWVPKPTDFSHTPGIFLSMSNPLGRTFVRLNNPDLDTLITSLLRWSDSLKEAVYFSTQISVSLKELDEQIHKDHPLINYVIKDISGVEGAGSAAERALPLGLHT